MSTALHWWEKIIKIKKYPRFAPGLGNIKNFHSMEFHSFTQPVKTSNLDYECETMIMLLFCNASRGKVKCCILLLLSAMANNEVQNTLGWTMFFWPWVALFEMNWPQWPQSFNREPQWSKLHKKLLLSRFLWTTADENIMALTKKYNDFCST